MKKDGDLAFRKKWIQWVLNFAQMDLKSLPQSRMKTLKEEIAYFCSERVFEESGEELGESWEGFEDSLSLATPGEYEAVTEISDRELSKIQKSIFKFLKALYNIHESEEPIPLSEMSSVIAPSFQGFKIYRYPKTDSPKDWLILNFIGLIERFETYPIKKCKGCQRFFLHLTKIEKVYCTSSCAARSIQREKLKIIYENPKKHQAFLKKWRRYQKERYEERMKAICGPNVQVGRKRTRKET
jgi:hypothetical protein